MRLWGTRGSLASPGPETVAYGGNTACVEVQSADGATLILDAGTGIRRLGATLGGAARIDILLSHLHADHIQGLGFFAPLFEAGREVHIWGPRSATMDLRSRLARYLSAPLFPVHLRELPSRLTLHDVPLTGFEIGGVRVEASLVLHPGPTLAYRLNEPGEALVYMSDHEPALGHTHLPKLAEWTSGMALAAGADLLIHDSQYSDEEYVEHVGWGHSSIDHAVAFAERAGVRRLVTFHHDPSHSDGDLEHMHSAARKKQRMTFELIPGMEGMNIEVASGVAARNGDGELST
jgi:phosphoribosyl 1,2-cyclic phosphodiesterase